VPRVVTQSPIAPLSARVLSKTMAGTHKILLVEDSADSADLVRHMLQMAWGDDGYELTEVATMSAAQEPAESGGFSCALLDLSLPDASGLEGVSQLHEWAPELPIVVLTGHNDTRTAVDAVREGAQDFLLKGTVTSELLSRSIRYAIERKRSELALAYQAQHDTLTGLANRTLLIDQLAVGLSRLHRSDRELAVLFIDLDGFKQINDTRGHAAGDRLLRHVAEAICSAVRPADTVARFGGDEFVVVVGGIAGAPDAVAVAHRITTAIAAPLELDGHTISASASIGIALTADAQTSPERLIRKADDAMYRAKQQGTELTLSPDFSAYVLSGQSPHPPMGGCPGPCQEEVVR
jgi:diguanylate cyclase (GGDEF)-like protein